MLVVQGDTDLQVGVEDAQRLAAAHRGARLVIIPGVNHIWRKAPLDPAANFAAYRNAAARIDPAVAEAIAAGTVEDWSREYWAKARDLAYKTINPDPCGPPATTRPVLTEAHIKALTPAVRRNVAEGGIRLARLLDDALGPQHIAPPLKR
jgi:hypothetical protein